MGKICCVSSWAPSSALEKWITKGTCCIGKHGLFEFGAQCPEVTHGVGTKIVKSFWGKSRGKVGTQIVQTFGGKSHGKVGTQIVQISGSRMVKAKNLFKIV